MSLVERFGAVLADVVGGDGRGELLVAGHSIGAWMALRLKASLPKHVRACILLCPTIQRMKSTPSGVRMSPILLYFRPFIVHAMGVLAQALPFRSWQRELARAYFRFEAPECALDGVASLLGFDIPRNAFTMAVHELGEVEELDEEMQEVIRGLGSRCIFHFAAHDAWNQAREYDDIRARFPSALVSVDPRIGHAFVLHQDQNRDVARRLGEWFAAAAL